MPIVTPALPEPPEPTRSMAEAVNTPDANDPLVVLADDHDLPAQYCFGFSPDAWGVA